VAGITSSLAAANSQVKEAFSQAVATLDPREARRIVRAHFRTNANPKSLEATLAWARTPVGAKIVKIEADGQSPTPDVVRQYVDSLEETDATWQRRKLAAELDKAGRVTEMVMQLIQEAMTSPLEVVPMTKEQKAEARKALTGQMNQQRRALEKELQKQVHADMLYVYRELSDRELREYIAFQQSSAGRDITTATSGAIGKMVRYLTTTVMKGVVNAVRDTTAATSPPARTPGSGFGMS
jgi:hypothetical protein